MMLKVYDFLRSIMWYIVNFIYEMIDSLLNIVKELNAFDIINSLADNSIFQLFYRGVCAIAITLFALFLIWRFINKILDPDDEITIKMIVMESIKCGLLIILSTFMFSQVSDFSISLSNYTGNIFESNTNYSISDNMLPMFITYNEDYKNSSEFNEDRTINELVGSDDFNNDDLYIDKFDIEQEGLFSNDQDYKYEINWIMAILCGGFFLYSMFFAGIMLGRRQIEFLFLFAISPIIFSTSICNKQRRGAVIEQMVSLVLQSAVIMLIVGLIAMVMQQINETTFFANHLQNTIIKALLYLGCGTFILTGSQTINRFIGANVSASSGREQLMSLMGYGKMAGIGGAAVGATAVGGALLATGGGMKLGRFAKNNALVKFGEALGTFGSADPTTGKQTKLQRLASNIGSRMYVAGQAGIARSRNNSNRFNASDALVSAGANSINSAIRTVMPRAGYNASYYRRRNRI